jgi:septal ring-binding cell division protein DamX
LQIGSVTSEKAVRRFLQENGIEAEAGYIAVQIDGTTRYNALYGSYPSYAEAQRAVTGLPPALQQVKPWIRNFGILQQLLK